MAWQPASAAGARWNPRAPYSEGDQSAVDLAMVVDAVADLVERDGCEVVVLAGAVMAGVPERLQARVAVPLLEGVSCAVAQAEMLVRLGCPKARSGSLAALPERDVTGLGEPRLGRRGSPPPPCPPGGNHETTAISAAPAWPVQPTSRSPVDRTSTGRASKRLAVFVAMNLEHYAFGEGLVEDLVPNMPPPDVLNNSWRDYGNRVGAWRMLDLFRRRCRCRCRC